MIGPVSEGQKWALLEGALALVSPSPWEAFSLVVAEAWSAGTPVVVNAECAATVEHCRRSGGGLSFAGFGEFEAVMDRLYGDEDLGPAWVARAGPTSTVGSGGPGSSTGTPRSSNRWWPPRESDPVESDPGPVRSGPEGPAAVATTRTPRRLEPGRIRQTLKPPIGGLVATGDGAAPGGERGQTGE